MLTIPVGPALASKDAGPTTIQISYFIYISTIRSFILSHLARSANRSKIRENLKQYKVKAGKLIKLILCFPLSELGVFK
jgi:hypothetical protein